MERLNNLILNQWNHISVKANVDEKLDDIRLAIMYDDHGDDFLYIETYDGQCYEYGYWLNRAFGGHPDSTDLTSYSWMNFIRRPSTYKRIDERMRKAAEISNDIYRWVENYMNEDKWSYGWSHKVIKKECDPGTAQRTFNWLLDTLNEYYEGEWFYHSGMEGDVLRYLKLNEIDTPENLEKLGNAHFSSRIDGVDGVAGKAPHDGDVLTGDHISFILFEGKEVDPHVYEYEANDYDEFGDYTYDLDLGQFSKIKDYEMRQAQKDYISKMKELSEQWAV